MRARPGVRERARGAFATDPVNQDGPAEFGGFEPVVGTVRAVRSFRVGASGELHPLYHDTPWDDPVVTARCLLHDSPDHVAPEPDCVCGLYAYSGPYTAREDPHARHVLGVVACWGRVVTGTRGLRAQHAAIEALWFGPRVPDTVVETVRARHPWVTLHRDRAAMLRAHPPSVLDGYDPDRSTTRRRLLTLAALAAALVLVLPANWTRGHPSAWTAQLGMLLLAAPLVGLLGRGARPGAAVLLLLASAAWVAGAFGGTVGEVLVRGGIVAVAGLGALHQVATRRLAARIPTAAEASRTATG